MCCCLCCSDLCLVLISVLFPPLPVWIRRGFCSADSFINILLCILGYLPGLIHSWYIIAKYPPYTEQNSKIYYIYRNNGDLELQLQHQHKNQRRHNTHRHYHYNVNDESAIIDSEPECSSSPSYPTYGAINDQAGNSSLLPSTAPPAYSELDNKVQR